jgi:hypothetical protein
LVGLIFVLALLAAGAGLFWPADGAPYAFTSYRGEQVTIAGSGLYRYDTLSVKAQEQANDIVTLAVGLPLLAISAWLSRRGSLRGRLLLTGTLGFFLYTYTSIAFLTAYNELFLVYVALMTLSLLAFVLAMMSFDLDTLPRRFSERLPRRLIAATLFFTGAFLLLAWVGGRILPTFGKANPGLDNTTTMVIQAMDLGLIVPLTFLGGWLLLQRSAWGYLLASVAVMKFLTMGLAVTTMGFNMARVGVPVTIIETVIFPALTLINVIAAAGLLRNIKE